MAHKKSGSRYELVKNTVNHYASKRLSTTFLPLSNNTKVAQLKPVCPCDGGCTRCLSIVQAKLTIGQPDDEHEREADRVANRVMTMSDSKVQLKPG